MGEDTKGTIAISIGLGLLGLSAGAICGLTVTAGAAQSLLTSLFTFVGGAVLSFSAFSIRSLKAKEKGETPAPPHVIRIGAGVSLLSIGLLLGAILGLWFRYADPLGLAPLKPIPSVTKCEPSERAPAEPGAKVNFGLQLSEGEQSTVERVWGDVQGKRYEREGIAKEIIEDIRELVEIVGRCRGR